MNLKRVPDREELRSLWLRHQVKVRFLFVGAWNTLFGFLAFVGLYKLSGLIFTLDYFAYTSAQVLGTVLSIVNAYIFHRWITFNSKSRGRAMVMEFLRFCSTYTVLFIVNLAIMPMLVEVLKIRPVPAAILLNVVIILTSYFGHSRFSFRQKR